jgi:thiol-disulfide isomerase/thioredoxin
MTLLLVLAMFQAGTAIADVTGHQANPLDTGKNICVVLIFVTQDCPVSNAYVPTINQLVKDYSKKKVGFFLVHVDTTLTREEAAKHANEFGITCPVLLDPDHKLVKKAGATITPTAAVYSKDGKLQYLGRIDDLFPELGVRRLKPTKHELRNALDAILAGKRVPVSRTAPVGCIIPAIRER